MPHCGRGPDDRPLDALVLDGRPALVETKKDERPATPVFGADVFRDEFARALLRYGTAERYVFFTRDFKQTLIGSNGANGRGGTNDAEAATGAASVDKRIVMANPGSIESLAPLDRVVLLSFRPHPQNFVPLRARAGKPWPIVSVIHALSSLSFSTLVCQLLTREMAERDAVICSTHAGRQAIQNLLREAAAAYAHDGAIAASAVRLPVIPIGVDCDSLAGDRGTARRALGFEQDAVLLLYFGRLTPSAKADLGPLICCFRELRRVVGDHLLLVIAGDDTRHAMAGALRDYAAALGCAPGVRVLPDVSIETKRQLYAAADVFVAPSDHIQETFGIALVEALASGLPVVASDWSGFREVVDDGVTGFLVPTYWIDVDGALELTATSFTMESRNTVLAGMTIVDDGQLYRRLLELVTNAELRARMGERAVRIARERYDWSRIIPRYETLFRELLDSVDGRPRDEARPRGPLTYDVQRIFSHYPRDVVHTGANVSVSERGRDWLTSRFPLSTQPDFPVDDADVAQMLQAADTAAPHSMQVLIDALSASRPAIGATWVVSRLLKYGLLRIER